MIIMAGIVSGIPYMMRDLFRSYTGSGTGAKEWAILTATLIILVLVVIGVIFMQNATRKIPIQYANRPNTLQGRRTHLPIN